MKLKQTMLLIFIIILISMRCDTNEPPPGKVNLVLTLEDVSCTEAWLTLKTEELTLPAELTLKQYNPGGSSISQILLLSTKDSLLYIDSLLPKQTYTFQATSIQNQVSSNQATASTLDTTSYNFSWQTFTFGEHSSSVLYDVAIINENNIWAVGEIYMNDSLGQPDPTFYNVVHWDGSKWELLRLRFNCRLYFPNCGPDTMLLSIASSIFAIDENNIWISAGSVHYFNGTTWIQEAGIQGAGSANKIWGNKNELWFVGNNGFIAQRNTNGNWTKIESGIQSKIYDIWGANREGEFILCGADNQLVKINNTVVAKINLSPNIFSASVWFKSKFKIYISGNGIFENNDGKEWKPIAKYIDRAVSKIRGNDYNDVYGFGTFGIISHFNGVNWTDYYEPSMGSYLSGSINGAIISAIGWSNSKAMITIGKR